MTRFQDPHLRALTEDSVQRTTHRGSVYLGRRTPTAVQVHDDRADWRVTVDLGEVTDPTHLFVAMSVEQAVQLVEQFTVALAAARGRGVA